MNTSKKIQQYILRINRTLTRLVTSFSQPSGAKATVINSGKGTVIGSAYEGFKHAARAYGFYQDIKPYLPETYIDKYRYKPHKRISYALQKTKGFLRNAPRNKFSKKCAQRTIWSKCNTSQKHVC